MVKLSGKVLKTVLVCFLILIGINGCKDNYTSVIPDVPVNININLANKTELDTDGGYYKVNGGYGGVIIFHDGTDPSQPFIAFDATCTNEILPKCSVETTIGSGIAICPCCGSMFILSGGYGSPVKGPATQPLKQYRTNFSGGRIIVTN